ncbi:hypothetical protein [Aestuariivivens sediminicola]|uniref:hypothetical protein n=1 Tax=Aestuariivivens sediminicola TaxID=2913560 RepID=UPI001F56CFAE|nr:hypothetical protein [Aestuariivivens sediminicola]
MSIIPLVLFSCYYDEFPEPVEQDDVVIPPDVVVSFADDIAPIFVTYNCTQCHDASGQAPDLSPGNAYASLLAGYVNPGNSGSSTLYIQLADNGHRNVDANSIALIAKWIDDGAENN